VAAKALASSAASGEEGVFGSGVLVRAIGGRGV
jgi:hypothetical protein